ncbi:hypothetical protein KGY63_00705, partial [Candidatus Bipolaricaulota bacterium]|nr:hypothetical protein [Candidatus Bipolaricaulota bacterium]
EVLLASGPTEQITPSGVGVVWVKTVNELDNLLTTEAPDYDLILMVGSASDWGPMAGSDLTEEEKTKKLDLGIPETPDLTGKLGKLKSEDQLLVEFATETGDERPSTDRLTEHNIDAVFCYPNTAIPQSTNSESVSGSLLFNSDKEIRLQAQDESMLSRAVLKEIGEEYFN